MEIRCELGQQTSAQLPQSPIKKHDFQVIDRSTNSNPIQKIQAPVNVFHQRASNGVRLE
jgi:hypothetical protein